MRRLLAAGLSLVLLLATVSTGHAQLGGLKKKLTDKATGKKPDTTAVAAGKPKCDKSSIVITSDVVDRYLKALTARDAEMQKLAKEPGKAGAYYAAYFKRREVTRRKREFDLRRGQDWERYKMLYPKMIHGDQAALQQQQALADSLEPNKVVMPELEWEAQQKGNVRLDSVMIQASGLSPCDWGGDGLGERMPRLVNTLVNDPETRDFSGYGTPSEAAAVKARLKELAAGLGYGSPQPTDAEKAHIKAEDEKLTEAAMATGDPYTDCATKVQRDFTTKHQAELDRAGKDRDMAASQRLTMLMLQETDKACKKFSKDSDDDE
jgi:hypothetical protein